MVDPLSRSLSRSRRIEQLRIQAERDAAELRAKATAEASTLIESARAEAEQRRHEVEQALTARATTFDQEVARRTEILDLWQLEIIEKGQVPAEPAWADTYAQLLPAQAEQIARQHSPVALSRTPADRTESLKAPDQAGLWSTMVVILMLTGISIGGAIWYGIGQRVEPVITAAPAPPDPPKQPELTVPVTYLLDGQGPAMVDYVGADGAQVVETVAMPWTVTVALPAGTASAKLTATTVPGHRLITCQIEIPDRTPVRTRMPATATTVECVPGA